MTDQERIERLENKLKDVTSWWRAAEKQFSQKCKETKANQKTIERLETKNAELRERLEKAVELPRIECTIIPREWLNLERSGDPGLEWCVLYKIGGWLAVEPCLSKEAAEARLKEIKEDNNG